MDMSDNYGPERSLKQIVINLSRYLEGYHECFRTETSDGYELCRSYITGLLKTEAGKRNIERINEEIEMSDNSYQRLQHFISNSPWSSDRVVRCKQHI
jgi:SRSO17 transposase